MWRNVLTPFWTVLHPGLKLEYFRQQKWENDWIETAETIMHEEYTTTYEGNHGAHAKAIVSPAEHDLDVTVSTGMNRYSVV